MWVQQKAKIFVVVCASSLNISFIACQFDWSSCNRYLKWSGVVSTFGSDETLVLIDRAKLGNSTNMKSFFWYEKNMIVAKIQNEKGINFTHIQNFKLVNLTIIYRLWPNKSLKLFTIHLCFKQNVSELCSWCSSLNRFKMFYKNANFAQLSFDIRCALISVNGSGH